MFRPYKDHAANAIYELLFCDHPEGFRNVAPKPGVALHALFAEPLEEASVRAIADDQNAQARLRVLAWNRLRGAGKPVPSRGLFGVIVEAPLEQGLDTLAAYIDGRIRYINQSGKMEIVEAPPSPELHALLKALMDASQAVVNRIGPWDGARLPPPTDGRTRMTFLVSDGLYFGEGPMKDLMRDALAGPLLQAAGDLLNAVVDSALARSNS